MPSRITPTAWQVPSGVSSTAPSILVRERSSALSMVCGSIASACGASRFASCAAAVVTTSIVPLDWPTAVCASRQMERMLSSLTLANTRRIESTKSDGDIQGRGSWGCPLATRSSGEPWWDIIQMPCSMMLNRKTSSVDPSYSADTPPSP